MTKPETPPATDMPPMVDQITRIVHESVVSALMDFEIPDEIIRNDPEIWQASKATADAILAALPDMVVPLEWEGRKSGHYRVHIGYGLMKGVFALTYCGSTVGEYQSENSAKEAANEHHRADILAALGAN